MQALVSGRLRSVAGASGVGERCETAVADAVASGSYGPFANVELAAARKFLTVVAIHSLVWRVSACSIIVSHVSEHPTPAVWAGCVGAQVVMVDHGW